MQSWGRGQGAGGGLVTQVKEIANVQWFQSSFRNHIEYLAQVGAFSDIQYQYIGRLHCKNLLRVVLTLLWIISVASGASVIPSVVSAAIWTWPQNFYPFITATEFPVIYEKDDMVPILWTQKFLLFVRTDDKVSIIAT